MLHAGGDDVVSGFLQGCGYAHDGGVVRLGAAAGEHHLAGAAVQYPRHPLTGFVESVTGFLPHGVDAGRVAEQLREVGGHRPEHLRRQRSGASVVHVDDAASIPVLSHPSPADCPVTELPVYFNTALSP